MNLKLVDFKAVAADGNYFMYGYKRAAADRHGAAGSLYYIGIAGPSNPRRPTHWDHSCDVPANLLNIVLLAVAKTLEGIRQLEKDAIARLGCIRDGGMLENKALGGQGAFGVRWTDESKLAYAESRYGKDMRRDAETLGVPYNEYFAMGNTGRKLLKNYLSKDSLRTYESYLQERAAGLVVRGREAGTYTGVNNSRLAAKAAQLNVPVQDWADATQAQRDYYPRWIKKPQNAGKTFADFMAAR